MIRLLLLTALMAVPRVALAQTAPQVEQAVRDADAARIRAFVAADVAALQSLLADDLTYTHSSGKLDGKTQVIDALQSGASRYQSIVPSNVQVRVFGTAAVLTGLAAVKVTTNGQALDLSLRFTSVYVQRDGRWQFAAWQSTRVAQP